MNTMKHLFFLFALAAGTAVSAQPYDLAVANVTLIDGTGGPTQTRANVLVRDGRIAAITRGPLLHDADEVVDGTGQYLIPGLIDAHTHPFPVEENFPRFIHYGVTSILITGGSVASDETLAHARALSEHNAVPSPRVFHTSQHFTMEGRHPVKTYPSPNWVEGETVYYIREAGDVEGFVEEVARQPIVGIKVTIDDGPEPPFVEMIPVEFVAEIVEEAHEHDLEVFAHVSSIEGVRVAEEAGVDHLVHFVGVDIDWERDQAVIDRLRALDLSWVTTLMIDKMFFYPAHPAWLDTVEATGVFDSDEIAQLREGRSAEESLDLLSNLYGIDDPTLEGIMAPQIEDLRQLHAQGFNLVVGTDTGNDFIFPGLSLHEELELLAIGFTPAELIPMATRNAAEMLGVLDEVGTLEVGKWADMVLLDQNPLDDIHHTRSIRAVFRSGQQQPRLEQNRSAELHERERATVEEQIQGGERVPTGWNAAEASEEGFDAERLEALTRELQEGRWGNIHALLIARTGRLVYEAYFAGPDESIGEDLGNVTYDANTLHDIRSISKTVTATLVGIALDEEHLPSVDTPLADLLPDHRHLLTGPKANLTLRHALTMSMGLQWDEDALPYTNLENDERQLSLSEDGVAFVLSRDLVSTPGQTFQYSGGSTNLLAEVLKQATGEPIEAYAERVLFEPLGITDWEWLSTGNVRPSPYAGLRLTGRDLAKFGQLYLDGGVFAGHRVVSEAWTREAMRPHVGVPADDTAPSFVLGDGYGYQWWSSHFQFSDGIHEVAAGIGNGEQRVIIIPHLNMVVTFLAGFYNDSDNWWTPERILMEEIVPAVEH